MRYTVGVDVGGTKISAGLVHGFSAPKIIKIPTEANKGRARIISNIVKAVRVFDSPKIQSIGIALAGEINHENGTWVSSPNIRSVKNIPLSKILKKELKKDIYIENDSNCFTIAEAECGAGKNSDYVVGLTLGTGVGSGFVIKKRIYRGANGRATEFGHMTIVENGYPCGCGQNGHLETYASGTGMIQLYTQYTGKEKDTFEIEKLALQKDGVASRVFDIMSESLAIGIANIINILNPDIVVLGGGLIRVKTYWKPAVTRAKKLVAYPILSKTKIAPTKLNEKAHILGAAIIARNPKSFL